MKLKLQYICYLFIVCVRISFTFQFYYLKFPKRVAVRKTGTNYKNMLVPFKVVKIYFKYKVFIWN